MPSTARTIPAPVRNSVCSFFTSRSGGNTPPRRSPCGVRLVFLYLGLAALVPAAAAQVSDQPLGEGSRRIDACPVPCLRSLLRAPHGANGSPRRRPSLPPQFAEPNACQVGGWPRRRLVVAFRSSF